MPAVETDIYIYMHKYKIHAGNVPDTIHADLSPTSLLKDASVCFPLKLLRRDWTLLLPLGAPSGMNDT